LVVQLAEHGIATTSAKLLPILQQVVSDKRLGLLLVAREGGNLLGVAYVATLLSAEHCGFVASLEELYVAPEARGRGVGSALLKAVFDEASGRGLVAIELEVDATHKRVMSLYRRFGFQQMDRTRWLVKLTASGE
jgi:ribosomal protein S18 acetylase RimI-like enzyme